MCVCVCLTRSSCSRFPGEGKGYPPQYSGLENAMDYTVGKSQRVRHNWLGFPDSSDGKESTCSAGDPSSIPVSGRSPGERIGYPLQYSWASLVAHLVKNLPECRRPGFDPWVGEDSLEKGKATHSSILAWSAQPMGSQRAGHTWVTFTFTLLVNRVQLRFNSCMNTNNLSIYSNCFMFLSYFLLD